MKMPRSLLAVILVALLVGCARTSATPILAGDGTKRFFLDCGRRGTAYCFAMANDACPNGYTVADEKSQTEWQFSRYGGGSSRSTTMIVICK